MNVSNGPSNDIVDDLDGLPETKIRKLDLSKSDEHLLLETVGLLAYEVCMMILVKRLTIYLVAE